MLIEPKIYNILINTESYTLVITERYTLLILWNISFSEIGHGAVPEEEKVTVSGGQVAGGAGGGGEGGVQTCQGGGVSMKVKTHWGHP